MSKTKGVSWNNNESGKKAVKTNSMTVALYCRVSKLDQHPENQEIELKDYAKRNNFEIYKIYIDRISGAKDSRPALNGLMTDARKKLFNAVVIWKVDRLGRSVAHMSQVIQEWQNLGIDLIITTLGIDTRTPTGKLILGILSQIAEFERELIRERILLGLERRKKQGKKLGRPKGSKDKERRPKSGYYRRWQNKGKKTTLGKIEANIRRANE
jgi:DNA invertase Pin-like site-specific DNA recombinase